MKSIDAGVWSWVLACFGLGVLVSALAGVQHHRLIEQTHQASEYREVELGLSELRQQLENAELLVRAVQALFLASEEVTAAEFDVAYRTIDPRRVFPGLLAFAYAERELAPGGEERYVTRLVAPLEGNEAVLGLDVGSQPSNLLALQRSRDLDRPVVSTPFSVVQTGRVGLTVRLPVFPPGPVPDSAAQRRSRVIGSMALSFDAARLVEQALAAVLDQGWDIRVTDVGWAGVPGTEPVVEPPLLLVQTTQAPGEGAHRRVIEFGERRWQVEFHPPGERRSLLPALTFAAGLLGSLMAATLVWSLLGTRRRALTLAEDLSSRYRESEARFRRLNDLMPAMVLLLRGADLAPVYANQAALRRLEVDEGSAPLALAAPRTLLGGLVREVLSDGRVVEGHPLELAARDGVFWASVSASRLELDGQDHVLVLANDITELRRLNEQLGYQASHDALTDMLNRREFERRLERALATADPGEGSSALLYLDLDQFKLINDTCGHAAGDQLLAEIAHMLKDSVASGDLLARLGGDEFGVLLQRAGAEQALAVGERLRERIDSFVFAWERRNFSLSVSVGVVVLDRPGTTLREVLAHADQACYMAKERGRNRVMLFVEDDAETTRRHSEMEWANRVREALREGRMRLDFQRIDPVRHRGRRAEGAHIELLVRMRDGNGGTVQPGAFIPAAERFGLMPLVDAWVLETALSSFDALMPGGEPLQTVAINLSGQTVDDDVFADRVLDLLQRHTVPAHKLCFEITETVAVNNMARVVRFMERIRAVGCRFALDDFGAGAASFGYLKNLPIDVLKIDGSFIRNIESDPVNYSIVRAVTDIGHQIGLEVIAEWVSDSRTRELLMGLGVDYVQGFGIHRPEPTGLD